MPAGHSVYVMRKESNASGSFELWDPIKGCCYFYEKKSEPNKFCGIKIGEYTHLDIRLTDPICPLTQIHTVVSSSNVYVCSQKSDYPILMDFDFTKEKNWKRYLNEDTPQDTVQKPIIYAKPKDHTEVIESRI